MEFFRFAALFFTGGIAGWVLELFFRRIVHHKWVNPGFLTGPLLPLYGFGLTALYYLTALPYDWAGPLWLQYVLKILFIGIAMTVVELIAGLIFIKGMKIKLWDYSDRWGNFQGIICPLFSLIWTAIGAGYVFLLHPLFVNYTNWIFKNPLPFLFVFGVLVGVLAIDIGYSFQLVVKIRKAVAEKKLVVDWDKIKASFSLQRRRLKEHANWIFAFYANGEEFKSMIVHYKEELAAASQARQEKIKAKKLAKEQKKEGKL
jgi:uncharacterized membrane protein